MNHTASYAALVLITTTLWTLPLGSAHAGEWRFGLGPSYASGVKDVVDLYEDNFNAINTYDTVVSLAVKF